MKIPKIPIKVSPFFWLTAALIGWLSSMGMKQMLISTLIWVGVIFVSVLVHEMGHALTALCFKRKSRIELVAFGGATYPEGPKLKGLKEFIMVLNGPLFGFFLFLLSSLFLKLSLFTSPIALYTLMIFQWVNLFWTLANLVPVMPLDGGQLLRIICESIAGARGLNIALLISAVISAVASFLFFLLGYFIIGALFFLFAFQNFDAWRKTRIITESDQKEEFTTELKEIENLMLHDNKEEVLVRLEAIRKRVKKGILFTITSQYLAALYAEKGEYEKVYELLHPIKKDLGNESLLFLHRAAYEMKDFPLVVELGGSCFQMIADPDIALHNAEGCAFLKQAESAIGWLRAAHKLGVQSIEPFVQQESFDPIRTDPLFAKFLVSLKKVA